MKTLATDNCGSRRFLSRRVKLLVTAVAVLVAVVAVLGMAFFMAWLTIGGGVWRSEVPVVEAALRSPDRLALLVDSCNGNPEVTLFRETNTEVQVKVIASSTPFRGGPECQDTVDVQLQEPLRDRVVVDKHTEQSVKVSTINPPSG